MHQGDLQALGQHLQAQLQAQLPQAVPIQVQCALKQGILLVLSQHSPGINPQPPRVFAILEQLLQSDPPTFAEFTDQVRLYLRVAGQKQPYAAHNFTLEPLPITTADAFITPEAITVLEEDEDEGDIDDPPMLTDAANPFELAIQPLTPTSEELVPTAKPRKVPRPTVLPLLAAGAGVGLFALAAGIYALTRPCVIGACTPIATAQELSQASAQTLQKARSGQDVIVAREKLQDAIATLKPIPAWSGQHGTAKALIQSYESQEQAIAQVVAAQSQAIAAAQKSQNPPHPLSEWTAIQGLWRNAIAQLEAVPQNSPAYMLAQKKRQEYQANLVATNKRLKAEQAANAKLRQAQDTAKVAEAREGIAQSLETWQLAHATWQTSINNLRQIPKGTMAHQEAQELLAAYQPKLVASGNRRTKEQLAANAYSQAIALARQAQSFEQQNQWSQAVANWRTALSYAKQVPNDTLYFEEAQPLVSSYNNSLSEAENKLQLANILEGARADLRRTCAGSPRICDFSVSLTLIKVELNPDYVRTLVRAAITAEANGDIGTQVDLRNHIATLEAALEAISQNARIPIELYDENDSLLGRYVPSF